MHLRSHHQQGGWLHPREVFKTALLSSAAAIMVIPHMASSMGIRTATIIYSYPHKTQHGQFSVAIAEKRYAD